MKKIATVVYTKKFTKGLLKDIEYIDAISYTGHEAEKMCAYHLLGTQANIERGKLNFVIVKSKVYPDLDAVQAKKEYENE